MRTSTSRPASDARGIDWYSRCLDELHSLAPPDRARLAAMVGLIRYTRLSDREVVRLEANAIDRKRRTIAIPEPNAWTERLPDEPLLHSALDAWDQVRLKDNDLYFHYPKHGRACKLDELDEYLAHYRVGHFFNV